MRVDEALISKTLTGLGYKRVKRLVYRALWSTEEVEHFMYFDTWGTPKDFLTAYFGLRNPRAEMFGVRSIRTHGGSLYRLMRHDVRTDCSMKFQLGMLAGWKPRSSIYLPESAGSVIAETITASVRGRMFPLVEGVTTVDRLLALLLTDKEPFIWARTNGAIRAAQIVDLARQRGMSSDQIRALLLAFKREIAPQIVRAPDPNPESYLAKLLSDSASSGEEPHPSASSG